MCKKEKVTYLRCALPKCDNPLTGKQRKFCSRKCLIKSNCLARKDVYKDLDGWAGGPRGLTTVESSIKYDETHVTGNGRFAVDDYHVDPDIFAIAEANHEQYVQDRNEHEAKVVIAGLEAFVEEYNKHHDVSYETLRSKKYLANLINLEECISKGQQVTRNYVKRQHTWWNSSNLQIFQKFDKFPSEIDLNSIKID